jgi:hypothetical protein
MSPYPEWAGMDLARPDLAEVPGRRRVQIKGAPSASIIAAIAVAIFVIENQLHAPSADRGVRAARSANPAAGRDDLAGGWTTATATPGGF